MRSGVYAPNATRLWRRETRPEPNVNGPGSPTPSWLGLTQRYIGMDGRRLQPQ